MEAETPITIDDIVDFACPQDSNDAIVLNPSKSPVNFTAAQPMEVVITVEPDIQLGIGSKTDAFQQNDQLPRRVDAACTRASMIRLADHQINAKLPNSAVVAGNIKEQSKLDITSELINRFPEFFSDPCDLPNASGAVDASCTSSFAIRYAVGVLTSVNLVSLPINTVSKSVKTRKKEPFQKE